jgi:hypothetical protein
MAKPEPKYIDVALMRHLYEYKDGRVITKTARRRKSVGSFASDEKGDVNGYRRISILKSNYKEHRVIWSLFNDTVPDIIDHINNDVTDNRIENLRESSYTLNSYNRKNVRGISYHKKQKTWFVNIRYKNKLEHIGCFKDEEFAELVAQEARAKWIEPMFNNI